MARSSNQKLSSARSEIGNTQLTELKPIDGSYVERKSSKMAFAQQARVQLDFSEIANYIGVHTEKDLSTFEKNISKVRKEINNKITSKGDLDLEGIEKLKNQYWNELKNQNKALKENLEVTKNYLKKVENDFKTAPDSISKNKEITLNDRSFPQGYEVGINPEILIKKLKNSIFENNVQIEYSDKGLKGGREAYNNRINELIGRYRKA